MESPFLSQNPSSSTLSSHPWRSVEQIIAPDSSIGDGEACGLRGGSGTFLGTGVFDRRDGSAVWRRFSMAEGALFDEAYIQSAISDAIDRRSDEACQRLLHSDADFLPGLTADLYGDVGVVRLETESVAKHCEVILECLAESVHVIDFVIVEGGKRRTASGNNLKPRWIEVEDVLYRMDFLNSAKPVFPLELREQHVLFGSLCEGRRVLDLYSHSGGFAMQAMRNGADVSVAVDCEETFTKAIGANAQRNELPVELIAADAGSFLQDARPGDFDAIVLDPPSLDPDESLEMHRRVFELLPSGGVLASYARASNGSESVLRQAAASAGREARIFARTAQPFDFPMLLGFPESRVVEGVLLEVL